MATATFLLDMQTAVTKFKSDTDTMARQAQITAQRIEAPFRSLDTTLTGTLGRVTALQAGIGAIGIGGLGLLVNRVIDAGDEIAKMATRTGLGVEALQELRHAADLANLSHDAFENGIRNLNRQLGEAANGGAEATRFFQSLGIAVKDSSGQIRSADVVLGEIADRFAGTTNQVERTRIAMGAFNRVGAEWIPVLEGGSRGLHEAAKEARDLGTIVDTRTVRALEKANDEITRFTKILKTDVTLAVAAVLPDLGKLRDVFGEMSGMARDFFKTFSKDEDLSVTDLDKRIEDTKRRLEGLQSSADKLRPVPGGGFFAPSLGAGRGDLIREQETELQRLLDIRKKVADVSMTVTGGGGAPLINESELKRLEAFRDLVAGMEKDLRQLDMTPLGKAIDEIRSRQFQDAPLAKTPDEQAKVAALVTAIHNRNLAMKEASDQTKALVADDTAAAAAVQRLQEAMRAQGEAITQEVITPLEAYQNRMHTLETLLLSGKVSQETYERATTAAGEAMSKATTGPAADMIASLQQQLHLLGLSIREQEQWAAALQASGQATAEQRDKLKELGGQIFDARGTQDFQARLTAITQETEQMQLLGEGQIVLARFVAEENALRQRGIELSAEQREQLLGVVEAQESMRQRVEATTALQQKVQGIAESIGDTMIQAALEGNLSWEDFLKNLIRQLLTVQNIMLVIKALSVALDAAGSGSAGAAGGGSAALAGGGPVKPRSLYLVGERGPELFISSKPGEILSNRRTEELLGMLSDDRSALLEDIQSAPMLGSGGIVKARRGGTLTRLGDLGKAETVIPFDMRESNRSGPLVEVNITNKGDISSTQTRRRGGDGREIVDIVNQIVDGGMASGRYDKAVGGRYGLSPTRGGR